MSDDQAVRTPSRKVTQVLASLPPLPPAAPLFAPAPWMFSVRPIGVGQGDFSRQGHRPVAEVRDRGGAWIACLAQDTLAEAETLGRAVAALPDLVEALLLSQQCLHWDIATSNSQAASIARVAAKRAIGRALDQLAWIP